ncbi:MAG: alpha/beta hydrolase [Actinomycetia bacterium]|nr:alpha/beta hydrolase [Actinomycetes bacterium]
MQRGEIRPGRSSATLVRHPAQWKGDGAVMSSVQTVRTSFVIDVGVVAPEGGHQVVVDVFAPSAGVEDVSVLWWLQPGGGMSRRYWDLDVPADVGNYSFARYLASRGFVAVAIDHLGVGESSRPADGFSLTSEVVADVNAYAFDQVIAGLRSGTLVDDLPPLPGLVSIGCGHSAGASLTIYQQARHRSHQALCLFGYGGRGLPSYLDPELVRYANDPEALRRDIVDLVRARNPDPLPTLPRGNSELLVAVPIAESVHEALVAARTNLLAVAGFSTMIPGNAAPEIAMIDVPVFIGHGDKDIGAPLHEVGSDFSGSDDVTLYRLAESGHNHNVSPNRERLWGRVVAWADAFRCDRKPW